jgi:hypothetical protein
MHAHQPDLSQETTESLLNLFATTDGFWCPHRSLARALLSTQKNASAYVEANRRLLDDMRAIVRKEQDVAFEISQKALQAVSGNGSPALGAPDVNAVFERATAALRALGEEWLNAQLRSLNAMRSHAVANGHAAVRVSELPRVALPPPAGAVIKARSARPRRDKARHA